MRSLIQDISFSFRLLRRHPLETALAVAALALGVGLSTAMFSILWGTVLRGLPYKDADRLMRIETVSQGERATPTDVDFLAWRRNQHSFDELAAFLGGSFNLSGAGESAARYNGSNVSANIFRIVQLHPLLGRDFQEADEAPGAPLVTIISEGLWKKQFNHDPGVIGKPIKLNGEPAQVVGVMAGDFGFPLHQEIWVPLQLDPKPSRPGRIQVLGKLKKGVSKRQAAADLQVSSSQRLEPKNMPGVRVTPYVSAYTEDLQPSLYLLLGASLGLLLVVGANVSGLLTAQTIARLPELAIRSAVGATRSRLLVQLMTETVFLTVAGFLLSLPLAEAAIRVYVASQGGELPSFWMDVRLDAPSIAYTLAITIVVSALSTVVPSFQVTGSRLNEVLKRGAGRGAAHPPGAGNGLRLAVQLALSFALLVGTGLIIDSLKHLGRLNFGAAPENVLVARVYAPEATYPTGAKKVRFFHAVEKRLEEALGPGGVAFTSAVPGGATDADEVEIEGQHRPPGAQSPQVSLLIVSPEYFRVLRLDALQGRLLDSSDRAESQPVAVINQSFVHRYFGDRPSVGARMRFITSAGPGKWRTIVGNIPDLAVGTPPFTHTEAAYIPFDQVPLGWVGVILRTPGKPKSFTKVLQKTVATIDPEVPVFWIATMQEMIDDTHQPLQAIGNAFLAFGAVALFLSLLGVYGVTAQSVISRSREMAVRLALGGQKGDLLRLMMRTALLQVGSGIALGALLSLPASRYVATLLFDVQAWEPGVFIAVGLLMALAGLLACFFPAARVLRAQPAEVLRGE
jgi:putative ABC transport system permease protein